MADEKEITATINQLKEMLDGTYVAEPRKDVDPNRVELYGGISGIALAIPEFELAPGLIIRDTFAHVMAPYLMAFGRPAKPTMPHPAPWKAAQGGLGFDVKVELALSDNARLPNLDRLNTLWWALALLRLITGTAIRMPVISNIAFASISKSTKEPILWTIEISPRQLQLCNKSSPEILATHIQWVHDRFVPGAALLDNDAFNRAFQAFDGAVWCHSLGSAILMIWAAIETLFRPGRRNITKTLSTCLATYLYPVGPERDRAYSKIEILYEARGSAAHDAKVPEDEQLLESYGLARKSFMTCLERVAMPNCDLLLEHWKKRV